MRAAPLLTIAAVAAGSIATVAVTAGPAASATSTACKASMVKALALEQDHENVSFWLSNGGGISTTCRDLNGDGRKDGQFLISSGGTGGAFAGGIVADDGNGPAIRAWVIGHSKTSSGFYKGVPAFAWPVYRKGDPNCCATGGWKVRRFKPSGDAFKQQRTVTLKSQKYPLKAKQ
ncbi:hypothetical protein AB0L40_22095 [Patulibacter sp. NPDC049589]|uniref:hypothetical protein n=1 Tax=Patulibacter sp. NPDC049589 TaxID=3154731 RepID=UPI0034143322